MISFSTVYLINVISKREWLMNGYFASMIFNIPYVVVIYSTIKNI